jgi:hypothetical protein
MQWDSGDFKQTLMHNSIKGNCETSNVLGSSRSLTSSIPCSISSYFPGLPKSNLFTRLALRVPPAACSFASSKSRLGHPQQTAYNNDAPASSASKRNSPNSERATRLGVCIPICSKYVFLSSGQCIVYSGESCITILGRQNSKLPRSNARCFGYLQRGCVGKRHGGRFREGGRAE